MFSVGISFWITWILFSNFGSRYVFCSEAEYQLLADRFRGYNPLVRPVPEGTGNSNNSVIVVNVSLQFVLLISVDEKSQTMHTNVWLTLTWVDYQMRWLPSDYSYIRTIRVTPDQVWLPDIVLLNNADGQYEVSFYSNVVVSHDGSMLWVPPAIFKSYCIMDVEYFPFDQQHCSMIFGSWTFKRNEVLLDFNRGMVGVDVSEYKERAVWDVIECPASLSNKRDKIEFLIVLRRKPLFYTVILVVPTFVMGFMSTTVFYTPTEDMEKVSLAVSITLALVVFLLLVSKILPPASTIPLLAKFLLLTFTINVLTILATVLVVHVHCRGVHSHCMPRWVRVLFIDILATLLLMPQPSKTSKRRHMGAVFPAHAAPHPFRELRTLLVDYNELAMNLCSGHYETLFSRPTLKPFPPNAISALEALDFVAQRIWQQEKDRKIRGDWQYVSMVMDKLLLYVFLGVTFGGMVGLLLSAPNVFELVNQEAVLQRLRQKYTVAQW